MFSVVPVSYPYVGSPAKEASFLGINTILLNYQDCNQNFITETEDSFLSNRSKIILLFRC